MEFRLASRAVALLSVISCGGSPSVDLGGSTLLGTTVLEVVESVEDSGAAFSDCRVSFDLYGDPHLAYRFRGLTDATTVLDALRYASGGSGEWRVDGVGEFAAMRPGFDLTLDGRRPRILFAATGEGPGPELVEAFRDTVGGWSQERLPPDATLIDRVRYLSQPTATGLRAILPPDDDGVFRDGYVAFDQWRFEPVGALEPGESVLSFDAAMDRAGGVHVCAVVSDGDTERLLYAAGPDGAWDVSEAWRGELAPACRIGAGEPGSFALAVLDESRAGQALLLLRPEGFRFAATEITSSPEIGDFDLVVGRQGFASLSWIDVPRTELLLAFETGGYEAVRAAVTDGSGSAALALSPDGTLAFCTERSDGPTRELVFGRVARTER